jgi:hypothetical protein
LLNLASESLQNSLQESNSPLNNNNLLANNSSNLPMNNNLLANNKSNNPLVNSNNNLLAKRSKH